MEVEGAPMFTPSAEAGSSLQGPCVPRYKEHKHICGSIPEAEHGWGGGEVGREGGGTH